METDFASALLSPPQPVVIGVRMKPFSLGHRLLLKQIQSAFITGEEFPTYPDLISTAFVCAHTWEENQRLLRAPFRRWVMSRAWGVMAGRFNVLRAICSLQTYINDSIKYPDDEPPEDGKARPLHAPCEARLYRFLRVSGFTESEAMNMPLMAANWMDAASAEEEGRLNLMSPQRRAFLDSIKAKQGGRA